MADIDVQEVEIEAIPIQIKEEVYCDGQFCFVSIDALRLTIVLL